jgi:nucleoid-associated protein YgaU/DNA-binding SARP family transcriptional activator
VSTVGRLLRFSAGLGILVVVLVGFPILLWLLAGNPLPDAARLPSLLAEGALDDEPVMAMVAVAAWCAWLVMVAELTLEVGARAVGRHRTPTAAAEPFAWLARRLVGLVALATPTVAMLSPPRLGLTLPAVAIAAPATTAEPALSWDEPVRYLVAGDYDSLWAIAERRLGTGKRAGEIASLNEGRVMPDGTVLGARSRLRRGYELLLPPDAVGPLTTASIHGDGASIVTPLEPDSPPGTRQHTVQRGETLWDLAERFFGDGFKWTVIWEANPHVADPNLIHTGELLTIPLPPGDTTPAESGSVSSLHTVVSGDSLSALADLYYGDQELWPVIFEANQEQIANPELIFAGQQLVIPPLAGMPAPSISETAPAPPSAPSDDVAEAPPPTVPPPTTAPSQPTQSEVTPSPAADEQPADAADSGFDDDVLPSPVTVFGVAGTLLAAGAFGAWHRRRRRRQVTLPSGEVVPAPPVDTTTVHRDLCRADLEPVEWIDRVLRHMAHAVTPSPEGEWPRPLVVQIGSAWMDVMLAAPWAGAPVPWRAELSGMVWQWDPPPGWAPPEPDAGCWFPMPALASVGAQDDHAQLLVDLEAAAVIGMVGDAEQLGDLARSVVLELACTPLRETVASVTLVGVDAPGVEAVSAVRRHTHFADAAPRLLAAARSTRLALDHSGVMSTFAARASGRLELAAPEVVVVGAPPDIQVFDDLVALVADHRGGVVIVCVGWCPPGAVRIEVADGQVRIPELGLSVRAQGITADTADQIATIIDSPDAEPEQLPLLDVPETSPPGLKSPDSYEDRPWEVLVRLLGGRPTVVAEGHRLTPKQVATLAYLSLHRSVTIDKLRDAAWGGRDVTPKRVLGVLSELRSALGVDLIPVVQDGVATVGRAVATDVDLFDRRVAFSRRQPPESAITTLTSALELVTAEPFAYVATDRDSYSWVDLENWGSRWDAKVTTAAHRLAELLLATGRPDEARRAAERGLAVCPAHTELTKDLIRAYGQLNQPEAAAKVANEYERVIDDLGISDDDDGDGETVWDVLRQVTGRRTAPSDAAG